MQTRQEAIQYCHLFQDVYEGNSIILDGSVPDKDIRRMIGESYDLTKGKKKWGYPKEFCAEIAFKNMNTDYTATRMLGYLYRVSDPRIEDLVDEMLAILSDRDAIIQKKDMEHAQAVINEIYRNGL